MLVIQHSRWPGRNPNNYHDLIVNGIRLGWYWDCAPSQIDKLINFNRITRLALTVLPLPPSFENESSLVRWILDNINKERFVRLTKPRGKVIGRTNYPARLMIEDKKLKLTKISEK